MAVGGHQGLGGQGVVLGEAQGERDAGDRRDSARHYACPAGKIAPDTDGAS